MELSEEFSFSGHTFHELPKKVEERRGRPYYFRVRRHDYGIHNIMYIALTSFAFSTIIALFLIETAPVKKVEHVIEVVGV